MYIGDINTLRPVATPLPLSLGEIESGNVPPGRSVNPFESSFRGLDEWLGKYGNIAVAIDSVAAGNRPVNLVTSERPQEIIRDMVQAGAQRTALAQLEIDRHLQDQQAAQRMQLEQMRRDELAQHEEKTGTGSAVGAAYSQGLDDLLRGGKSPMEALDPGAPSVALQPQPDKPTPTVAHERGTGSKLGFIPAMGLSALALEDVAKHAATMSKVVISDFSPANGNVVPLPTPQVAGLRRNAGMMLAA